ncbi:MAG: hypothetical protein HYY76_13235 [Acidobacteria bacterium]|nr:hypothetical protein [Acidobacteriota bacterium]
MASLDERVALLEGRVQEQATQMTELRTMGAEFRQELRDLREEMRQEFRALRDEMDRRFDHVERRFTWLVGMMVTGFLAVIGTVAGGLWGLLQTIRTI